MSITITQIAKLAGVSRGTVDRVIHQRGRVAPEVEKRIRDIMDENDYHPNMLGRALAVSKTPLTIGMIMIEKGNLYEFKPRVEKIKNQALTQKWINSHEFEAIIERFEY